MKTYCSGNGNLKGVDSMLNIYTSRYGYLTDIRRMTINEYRSMNIRYMFSSTEKVNGQQTEINVYEERETANLYYIPESEIADWLKKEELK